MLRNMNVNVVTPSGVAQADATAISALWSPSLILASGNGDGGVRLPTASKGMVFYVKNINRLNLLLFVYPATGDNIDIQGTNVVLSIPSLGSAMFVADANHRWHTLPALSS